MSKQEKNLSRRAFIGGAGTLAVGSVAAALGAPSTAMAAPTAVPWPVPRLNPDAVRDAGYWAYWANDPWRNTNFACCYGVAAGLIGAFKAGLGPGSPWEALPLEMFKFGKTGCVETGTLCGAIAGVLPIFSIVAPGDVVEMGKDLMAWYQQTALPSREMDYLDPKRPYPLQAQSVSESPLCHISVSRWCKAAGKLAGSNDRKTRCGKLTGDVAKMAAIILNRYVPGQKYLPLYPSQPELYAECVHCHVDAPPPPTPDAVRLNDSLGVTNCVVCHPDSKPVYSKK